MAFARRTVGFARRFLNGYLDPNRFTAPAVPHLSIETTNVCNADCVFCANRAMKRRKGPLPLERFERAVDDFAGGGGAQLDFNVTIGDPLLDPYLLQRARYVRKHGQFQSLGFVTTLQWLHRFDTDEFFAAGFTWLSVSTTLSGREQYQRFFRVDKYDQALRNLIHLLNENRRRSRPLWIGVDVKPTDEPIEQVLAHPDFRHVDGLTDQDLAAQVRNRGFFVDDWQGAVTLPPYLKLRPLYPRARRPCRMLYKGLVVYANGRVGACQCRDFEADSELILGNVEDGLHELWRGPKLEALRREWRRDNRIPDICRTCRYYMH